jgi:hypothetical protein
MQVMPNFNGERGGTRTLDPMIKSPMITVCVKMGGEGRPKPGLRPSRELLLLRAANRLIELATPAAIFVTQLPSTGRDWRLSGGRSHIVRPTASIA